MSSVTDTRRASAPGTQPAVRGGMFLAIGGLCGLAWAAGLRGLMAEIAGFEATVNWTGTFVWVLAPGLAVGMLLGWAD
jgi:hypothetical protein